MPAQNPYKPPAAALRDPPRPPRSPFVAILAGLGVDIGGTTLAGIVIGIVYSVILAARGQNPEQIVADLTSVDPSSGFFIFNSIVGGAFSLLGGYVCARLVRRDERRFTAIMAASSVGIGIALGGTRLSVGLNAAMLVLTFASVMAGGELGRRRNVADARKASAATAA